MVPHTAVDLERMASITIKNIPDRLLARLRAQAATENRSMNREIIRLLDLNVSVSENRTHPIEKRRSLADTQVRAWSRLAGKWISDVKTEDEIASIYSARSRGREFDF